jgi:peptidoglycan hydrolase-like protein with peptidoglycan-binding domain
MKKILVFGFALVLLLSAAVMAGYREGMSAFLRKDYKAAFGEFKPAAESGDPDAQFMLGKLHVEGLGVLQDYVTAHKWLNLSGSQGNRDAMELRDRISERMTANQLAKAQGLAAAWQAKPPAALPQSISPETPEPSREETARLQEILGKMGYSPGVADGVMGEKTKTAIRAYQAASGLPVDGKPSLSLLERLEKSYTASQQEKGKPGLAQETKTDGTEQLVKKLRDLAAETERKDAAQAWVIDELWAIVRLYGWSWQDKLIEDSFTDGNYTVNPSWTVASGRFYANTNSGLRTTVSAAARTATKQELQTQDLPGAIIGMIFKQATGEREGTGTETGAAEKAAEIYVSKKIANAFAMRLVVQSRDNVGRLEFGPYYGQDRDTGYRLALNPGAPDGMEMLRVSGGRSAVVEVRNTSLNFSDGSLHTIEWTRDDGGEMAVFLDDKEVIKITDRRYGDAFDGFTIINKGGDYTIRKVELFGSKQSS